MDTEGKALETLRAAGYTCSHDESGTLLIRPSAARGTYWPSGCGSIRFNNALEAQRFLMSEARS